jgi:hypothetical protein
MNAQRSPTAAPRARKRGHGEGSIYQRRDGRWVGTIRLGYKPDGRPDRPKVYGRTRGEVQKALRELRRRQEEGLRVDPALERQTLATFLEQWLEITAATVRPRTLERYQEVVRGHLVPALGNQRLASLRPEALQRLYARKLAAGLAPRTVVKIHVVLHRALAMALRWTGRPCRSTTSSRRARRSWPRWWIAPRPRAIGWPRCGPWRSTPAAGRASCSA